VLNEGNFLTSCSSKALLGRSNIPGLHKS